MNTTQETSLTVSKDAAGRLADAFREPAASRALRAAAWEAYESFPLPTTEDEAWRRTRLLDLDLARFRFSAAPLDAGAAYPSLFEVLAGGDDEAYLLVQDDAVHRRVPPEWDAKGVVFIDLASALVSHGPLIEKHLGQVVPARRGKFEALSGALWNRGIFLYVPKGVEVSLTLRGGYGGTLSHGEAVLPRTLIVLEAGARATYFDEYASSDVPQNPGGGAGQALSCGAVEIVLGPDAVLSYVNIQRWGAGVWHFLTQHARLDRGARLTSLAVALGGSLSKVNLGSELVGEGASSQLNGLVFGDGAQHFTHHTMQTHRVPSTDSDLLFKAALKDRARSIYTGLVHIDKVAQKTVAYQANRNLLLSPDARANTIPMLEILADDVKCGHGATVGSLDDDQRFYLMSRGLSQRDAEHAIVEGFFEDVLQRVPGERTREKLRAAIDFKLDPGDAIGDAIGDATAPSATLRAQAASQRDDRPAARRTEA